MKEFSQTQQYEIATVTNDLRHEEMVHQIADSLDHLHAVMTDVFSKVEKRISSNRTRLISLNDRARLAQAKIDHLATIGKKKATQVFSSSKYPASDKHNPYTSMFESDKTLAEQKRKSRLKNRYHQPLTDKDLKDKLVHPSLEIADKENGLKVSGLGSLPSNIDSVSSLLLFNTSENLYKNYVLIDPRGVVTRTKVIEEDETQGRPDEAPSTITTREEFEHANKENLNYNPNLGNVPDFSVPADLPDLSDIADDIRFDNDISTIQSIAPSVFAHIPDLPDIQPETMSSEPPPPPPAAAAAPPPPPAPGQTSGPPAPPPPPAAGAPPPPPPPPPGPAPPPPPPVTTEPPSEAPSAKPDVPEEVSGDGRSNLMDAIRKAGGAGKASLKSAVKRVQSDNKKKKEASKAPASGGDLFADLAMRLAGRRKGIAGGGGGGKAAEEEIPKPPAPIVEAPTGAMSRMSDMIAYNPVSQHHDDDADWGSD